ncbi:MULTISPECIES: hypothetical protein [Streptomyces]|uniref:hypothetical protein n=1 Tax=Streptomyces TaxID=1883 RepID=UPI001C2EDAE6|nr:MULTISPECIES: hypothetical protein [Streptomyces]MBV1947393.1 hypothetical protein [Streptomyces sp. BV129]BDH07723.1 hypothetical protein HEK131_49500 [Streptomyces seoulensis]
MKDEPDLQEWAEGERWNVVGLADSLGVPPEAYAHDPMSLISAPQDYVSRAPFDEFEQSDWVTLHADPMSYGADYLVRRHETLSDLPLEITRVLAHAEFVRGLSGRVG